MSERIESDVWTALYLLSAKQNSFGNITAYEKCFHVQWGDFCGPKISCKTADALADLELKRLRKRDKKWQLLRIDPHSAEDLRY